MRNYQKITQNAEGQLLAWYGMPDHTWNVDMDFDVLQDYAVYPHETGAFIAEYLPAKYCFWSYRTLEEALEAVLNKINEKKKLQEKLDEAGAKFQEVVKKNSLDERYKDKVVEKKQKPLSPYLQNLRRRTEEMHASIEKWRMERNRQIQMSDWYEARHNH